MSYNKYIAVAIDLGNHVYVCGAGRRRKNIMGLPQLLLLNNIVAPFHIFKAPARLEPSLNWEFMNHIELW